jgi:uncharacterized protein YbjT (DUF2867 family)
VSEIVLVVGGTRGTGALIAERLLATGRRVRILARDPRRVMTAPSPAVDIVRGDITRPTTLPACVQGATHIVFTAGVHSGRFASETLVKLTDYEGVRNTLAAARAAGFNGRFVYLNSIGVTVPSFTATMLNALKRNTLVWRRRVEDEIKASGLDYTIIRVGFLLNVRAGTRAVRVSQRPLPLAPWHRIGRADVAEVFVAALGHPRASRATFDIVWGDASATPSLEASLSKLQPDAFVVQR